MTFTTITEAKGFSEVLIIPLLQDDRLKDKLAAIEKENGLETGLLGNDFKAEFREILSVYPSRNFKKIWLLGLGKKAGFPEVLAAFRSFTHKMKGKLPEKCSADFQSAIPENADSQIWLTWLEAAANGILLGRYDIGLYKTEKKDAPVFCSEKAAVGFVIPNPQSPIPTPQSPSKLVEALRKAQTIADTQLRIFDLVNAPGNKKLPVDLGKWALESGKKFGFKVKVLDKKACEKEGLHALLAVNQGSENPPAFIILEYEPPKSGKAKLPKIGLVGKGVTFDTGGVSIKASANMHYMKSDMGGAAAVLGAIELCARLALPARVVGVIPSTENCVDGRSIKPGDVIGSYSGKTIEVIDTDAEGRLILADGLAWIIKKHAPDTLLDLATLTGSIIRTLGYTSAGLFSSNDDLATRLLASAEVTGERLWRMPMWDVYGEDIKSDVADVKNFSGKPVAESISAAKFLETFTEKHPAWAHLDIAGMAIADGEFSSQRSATAFGVRLLVDFVSKISQ